MDLVIDRTLADVLEQNAKGTYNASDLNRVESAVLSIYTKLHTINPTIDFTVDTKTDWMSFTYGVEYAIINSEQMFTESEATRFLLNINNLKSVVNASTSIPTTMNNLTYTSANNIEKVLIEIDTLLDNIYTVWCYGGNTFCGEAIC